MTKKSEAEKFLTFISQSMMEKIPESDYNEMIRVYLKDDQLEFETLNSKQQQINQDLEYLDKVAIEAMRGLQNEYILDNFDNENE